jgi:hypothetical protein
MRTAHHRAGSALAVSALIAAGTLAVAASPAHAADTGSIAGTVTGASAAGLNEIKVSAWRVIDGKDTKVASDLTDATGAYSLDSLVPSDSYFVQFEDPTGEYTGEWFDNVSTRAAATAIPVEAGPNTGKNASLAKVPSVTTSAAPTIGGTVAVGQTLTANTGTFAPTTATVTYAWLIGTNANPAVAPQGKTYVLTAADLGKTIKVQVTGTATGFKPVTATSAATVAVAAGTMTAPTPPAIKGKLKVGKVLWTTNGTWSPAAVSQSYQWYAGGKAVSGAKGKRSWLALSDNFAGKKISLKVTGSATAYTSLVVPVSRTGKVKS